MSLESNDGDSSDGWDCSDMCEGSDSCDSNDPTFWTSCCNEVDKLLNYVGTQKLNW